jgi:glycerol-3-phosphate O-acyltransferase 3/4
MTDVLPLLSEAAQVMTQDTLTSCFDSIELEEWNFLHRTKSIEDYISSLSPVSRFYFNFIYLIGSIVRYCILLPLRICFLFCAVLSLLSGLTIMTILPVQSMRKTVERFTYRISGWFFLLSWSAMIEYHGEPPGNDGIVIANHTSIIDVIVLLAHSPFALIGQSHGGFLGWLQSILSKGDGHIWFERAESRDRKMVSNRLKEHAARDTSYPVLVFPEGTCVNNEYILMFRKGNGGHTGVNVCLDYSSRFIFPLLLVRSQQAFLSSVSPFGQSPSSTTRLVGM